MSVGYDSPALLDLLAAAKVSADKATRKFPQPNYVCAKLAEEAGEVVRAYIHMEEGRGSRLDFEAECVQLVGLVLRLYVEGDQTVTDNAPYLGD